MKRTMGGAALLAAVMAVAPLNLDAQMGPRGQRGQAMGPRGAGVEMILRQRERLELTDAQVSQLDQLRQEAVQRRTAHQAQVAELRSKVAAGQLEAAAFREQVQSMWEGAEGVRTQQQERVEGILTDAQRQSLQQWGAQARAFRMGRQSALRGQRGMMPGAGIRGGRAMAPRAGVQRGFAPGMRQRWAPGAQGRIGFRRGPGEGPGFGPPEDSPPR
ncbi:MAG: hypothetical protein AMXMBFR53_00300 [Gemmatimonadota bacterium]